MDKHGEDPDFARRLEEGFLMIAEDHERVPPESDCCPEELAQLLDCSPHWWNR